MVVVVGFADSRGRFACWEAKPCLVAACLVAAVALAVVADTNFRWGYRSEEPVVGRRLGSRSDCRIGVVADIPGLGCSDSREGFVQGLGIVARCVRRLGRWPSVATVHLVAADPELSDLWLVGHFLGAIGFWASRFPSRLTSFLWLAILWQR